MYIFKKHYIRILIPQNFELINSYRTDFFCGGDQKTKQNSIHIVVPWVPSLCTSVIVPKACLESLKASGIDTSPIYPAKERFPASPLPIP